MRLVILSASVALIAAELLLVVRLLVDRRERRSIYATLAVVLAVLAPVFTGFLTVLGFHLRRIAPFIPIGSATAETKQEILGGLFIIEPLARLGGHEFFGGIGLLALALTGLLLSFAVRTHLRRAGTAMPGAGLACIGASILAGICGLGFMWSHIAGKHLAQAWDAGPEKSRALSEALPLALQPVWLHVVLWSAIVLLAIAGAWIAVRRLAKARIETPGLLACVMVLALGAGAFAFTRGHASDAKQGLKTMIDPLAGPVYQSALFGKLERGMFLPDPIKLTEGVQLPVSNSDIDVRWAINIAISRYQLEVEGNKIASLEAGQFLKSTYCPEGHGIETLFQLMSKYKEIESQEKVNPTGEHDDVALQADGRLPYLTVWEVMRTAGQAGYPNFRVVVRNQRQHLPSRLRIAIINVSIPVLGAEGSSNLPGLRSLGDKHPPPEKSAANVTVRLAKDRIEAFNDPAQIEQKAEFRGTFDQRIAGLTKWVSKHVERHPKNDTLLLIPDDDVSWQEVISCLDATRERVVDPLRDTRLHLLTRAFLTREIR